MRALDKRPMKVLASVFLAAVMTSLASSGRANERVYAQAVHGTVLIWRPDGGYGTGVLVDAERRLVVTADHVPGTQEKVIVVFAEFDARGRVIAERAHYFTDDQPRGVEATVIQHQPDRDLAVLQLASLPRGVVALPLAADSPKPGQAVHVIGNACLSRNALFGTRSGKVDSVYRNEPTADFPLKSKLVATSIATNKGDSGGPILNDQGELVGIVSAGTICWGTAKKAAPGDEDKIADHPLARQQAVNLSIDVTEVRTILQAVNEAAPKKPLAVKTGRSVVGGRWVCAVGDGEAEAVFRADGTYRLTRSDAEGVVVDSERGRFTSVDGQLSLTAKGGEQTVITVTWKDDNDATFTVDGRTQTWRRP